MVFYLFAFIFFSAWLDWRHKWAEGRRKQKNRKMQFFSGKEWTVSKLQIQGKGSIHLTTIFPFEVSCSSFSFGVSEHWGSKFSSSLCRSTLEEIVLFSKHLVGTQFRKQSVYFVWLFFSRLGKLVTCFYYGSPWYAWFLLIWPGLMEILFLKKGMLACQQWIAYLK